MRTKEQKRKDTMILNIIKAISILILVMYCFFNEFLLNHIGGLVCIVAASFMIVPRKVINKILDEPE